MIYFASGHLDLTDSEFKSHYADRLAIAARAGDSFVVGDARGCDVMVQQELVMLLGAWVTSRVEVFHMFDTPRHNVGLCSTRGGFQTDDERDAAMTNASDADIAWVRPGRGKSGTARNLIRRGL